MKSSRILKKLGSATKSLAAFALVCSFLTTPLMASSHREAPLISLDVSVDNTDVYAFRSTEPGRERFVTIIANFWGFQEPSGGPQFYRFDDSARYNIKVDNTGDGREDITIQFRFNTQTVNGNTVLGRTALNQDGIVSSITDADFNMPQTYNINFFRSVNGQPQQMVQIANGVRTPPENIGPRVTPSYENLATQAIQQVGAGRVFAGQREEGFFIDVGGAFDLLNFRSPRDSGGVNTTQGYNVNTIAIEIELTELTRTGAAPTGPRDPNAVVGIWATSERRATRVLGAGTQTDSGDWVQVSRLGNPLVNEVVIPLRLKDAFNAISPAVDGNIPDVVNAITDPQLPRLMQAAGLIPDFPPPPRNDLVAIFATGIRPDTVPGAPDFNTFLSDGTAHEMMRLNVAIPPSASPSRLGLLGGDPAGFPNGRRPFDDVVDIALRVMAGGTPFTPAFNRAPNNIVGDGVSRNERPFLTTFPYLATPYQGNQPDNEDNFPSP